MPEPIGIIPSLRMWLQRKVHGVLADELLFGSERGIEVCGRLADVAAKLHRTEMPARRRYTITDELRILNERLALVAEMRPEWEGRLHRLFTACQGLARRLPAPREAGIHRDYYPGQVIIDGPRAYLLDLDLYRQGDPALDIGNCRAHITEMSLRVAGDAAAWSRHEDALVERYLGLCGAPLRDAVDIYSNLSLVRHVYISTQFADREMFTDSLLSLSESRLKVTHDRPASVAKGSG